MDNCTTVLMKQDATDIDYIYDNYHLSEGEKGFLLSCGVGRLSIQRLVVLLQQVSRDSPPNHTYTSQRIRLSFYS